MTAGVFVSHTKLDKNFCDRFDTAVARVGLRAFRSEFESIEPPAWSIIRKQMAGSLAMFLLVGKRLVNAQASVRLRDNWKYTQNWISFEVGLACQLGIDVWVVCDNVEVNFPVPYLNNYSLYGLSGKKLEFMVSVLRSYANGNNFPLGYDNRSIDCPHRTCGSKYNLHSYVGKGKSVKCPTCLRPIVFPRGWLAK